MTPSDQSDHSPELVVDPASQPALHFCNALAVHVKSAYPERLSLESWRAAMGESAPEPSTLDVGTISQSYLIPNVSGQARLSSLLEYPPSKWLLEQEMQARGLWPPANTQADGPPADVYRAAFASNQKGLSFSGGGIRSATFNLGILQALASRRKLGKFDYLSTVSGGGYIHQFVASWIECEDLNKVEEQLSPLPWSSTRTSWPDPIRWLRRYSNYLTPRKGLLTADTWVAVSIWLRNAFLNQIIVLSTLLFVLLLPHFNLLYHFDPSSQTSSPLTGSLAPAIVTVLFFAVAAITLPLGMRKGKRGGGNKMVGFGGTRVLLLILLPIAGAIFTVSPFLYRSAFPDLVSKPPDATSPAPTGIPRLVQELHTLAPQPTATTSNSDPAPKTASPGVADNVVYWLRHYTLAPWTPLEPPLSHILIAFLLGQALLIASLAWSIPQGNRRVIPSAAAVVVAVGSTLVLIHIARLILVLSAILLPYGVLTRFSIVFVPILLLAAIFIPLDLAIGVIGRCMDNARREWLARLRALSFLAGFVWLAVVGCSLLGPALVTAFFHLHKLFSAAVMGWVGTTVASLFAGKSGSTTGEDSENASPSPLDYLVTAGPPVFLVGLMLALAWVLDSVLPPGYPSFFVAFVSLGFVALFFSWRVDINDFSLSAAYRDRLARCYAGASNPDRRPNAFTGFARSDARLRLVDLLPQAFGKGNPSLWRKKDVPPKYQGPFPILCATLNLSFGEDLAYQERKGASFAFTPLFCGYDVGWTEGASRAVQFNGYFPTNRFAIPQGGPHLSTAVATSGASESPNEGFHTNPAMAFLMTIFNVRLGWWVPNPRNQRLDLLTRMSGPTPVIGLPYLLRELFGEVSDDAPYINLSDGGHFDNMGLYELVRRRCRNIIICDAEEDHAFVFEGLGMAIRKCRIDFGVEVSLDLDAIIPGPDGLSKCAFAIGKIKYPAGQATHGEDPPEPVHGNILYIKSTLTGKEPADILNYKREHKSFPSDSTLNQWFTESQFESYRRLGQFIGENEEIIAWLDEFI
ncbi:hypothetical protein [Granulicella sp. dw_53]|uniref:hypothetical protein n=1 Tax=Granulicella sp. dw_53 TaxID=2719792 RepID=UPI001BD53473|nr:hypothetical protein [Granulicella sp. dw_53]